ncbi:MAG: c-type cytochrome [Phycisphaerales bacterium]|nr:c-type cytochrome [Phycisphaerales bacterium]
MIVPVPRRLGLLLLGVVTGSASPALGQPTPRMELRSGDRIIVVGNTFAERVASSGYFEAMVHAAHPERRVAVRHVPWSGDEVARRPREHSVPSVEDHITQFRANVIVAAFGMSESFAGMAGLADFERDLAAQLDAWNEARIVLLSPIAHEDLGAPFPTGGALAERNRILSAYVDVMRRVAASHGVQFVDLFEAAQLRYVLEGQPLTSNGIHPNERGCFHFTRAIGRQLGWVTGAPSSVAEPTPAARRLRALAADKHYHERLVYRPTNTEYVWGRRHEPYGIVNFPPEWEQLERMIDARQRALWDGDRPTPAELFAAAPRGPAIWEAVPTSSDFPEDTWTPAPVVAKGRENSLGSLDILPPDEFKKQFTLPDGYVVECFASEQTIPELRNPLAMTFDATGRLWVLCAGTYPHLLPGAQPECTLLVLEDTDGDGRADRRTVWAEDLYVPTGFAVDTDAVYIGQAPDLWKYTDTDGDGVSDRREIVASGFGMCDSHHQISAFEWDPNGGFLLHEGVFTNSNVETPRGTLRTQDAAVWRFDPRTRQLRLMSHCGFSNPWGHVFDDYGQSVLADASGGDNYSFSHVISVFESPKKPRRVGRFLNRGRPTAGCELISSRHFPDDVQETFLVNQSIGFHGARWSRMAFAGSAWSAEAMPEDLLESSDVNFRPVAMEIGPDGALYIVDWCNPLVGHMQYSVRDPRRDHTHGRVWRVRHASRDLLTPPAIATTTPELLEQLRIPERNTRQHARRRLQTMPPPDVFPELARWTASLDAADPLHDRLWLETLWLHQAHGRVDLDLLDRVATLAEPRARAGALRVLRHWLVGGHVTTAEAVMRLERAVRDDDMRVRLEAVVACGFVPDLAAASVAALAETQPMDDGLRIAWEETLAYLARFGTPSSDVARRLQLERLEPEQLLAEPLERMSAGVQLVRADVPETRRHAAAAFLAESDGRTITATLVEAITAARRPSSAVAAVGPLLLAVTPADLARSRDAVEALATHDDRHVRALAYAALSHSGDPIADRLDDEPSLASDVLAHLPAGAAPAEVLTRLRAAVEAGVVEPTPAITQIVRHATGDAAVSGWLRGLVEPVADVGLHRFDGRHEVAMAALRGLSGDGVASGETAVASYRIAPIPEEVATRGAAIYADGVTGCARCHGPDGRGEEGFPPLDRSPWVLGEPARAAAVVVHGLHGVIEMPGGRSFESVMEPLGALLDDQQIADVLSYVRQSWGNYASVVTAADVARGRALKEADGAPLFVDAVAEAFPLRSDRIVPVVHVERERRRGGVGPGTVILTITLPIAVILALVLLVRKLDPVSVGG